MADCHHHDADGEAPGRTTLSLEAESLFLVGVSRAWTAAQQQDPDAADWRHIFQLADLPAEAATAYGSFMALVMQSSRRPLEVRCCSCPEVGPDEEALLRIIGAVQAGDLLAALEDLDGWLHPGNRTPVLRAAGALAARLAGQELLMPYQAAPARPGDRASRH